VAGYRKICKETCGQVHLNWQETHALRDHKGVIVQSQGTFAAGKILEEAYIITSLIERSCKLK